MQTEPNKHGWALFFMAFSPAILCLVLGLLVLLLPQSTSTICAALLSREIMMAVEYSSRDAVTACSVLAVQASAALPLALFVVILLIRNAPDSNAPAQTKVNVLIFMFLVLLTFMLWMDLFFVGSSYLMMSSANRPSHYWGLWLAGTSLTSLAAVACAALVLALTRQKIRAIIRPHRRGIDRA